MSKIHINLDSINVPKIDIDKLAFGLLQYAKSKKMPSPYKFTANTSSKDINYLGVIKNNSIRLIEKTSLEDYKLDKGNMILYDSCVDKLTKKQIMLYTNMPIIHELNLSRACVYIDWDNMQVSLEFIKPFILGITKFINDTKIHNKYEIFSFVHNKVTVNVKEELKSNGVNIVNIIKDKSRCGDGEIISFIRENTKKEDSVCIVSGDRDFSPLMIEYVRNSHNVFLIYNKQALYTFKNNKHWLSSKNIRDIEGVGIRTQQRITNNKKKENSKPCKFYNLDNCNTIGCKFLHICGFCGRDHKIKDFHPKIQYMKNIICKKYNNNMCLNTRITCDFLHICQKCKKYHPLDECDLNKIQCPICLVEINSKKEFILHMIDDSHIKKINIIKRFIDTNQLNKNNIVLNT